MELPYVALAGVASAVATGGGAIPVALAAERARAALPLLGGIAIGAMVVASIVGLLAPALDAGSAGEVVTGALVGLVFVLVARRALAARRTHTQRLDPTRGLRSALVFGVLLVHSLPEGLALGAAFASETEGLGLFITLAIALQNVPEGTAVALPMQAEGQPPRRQVLAAIASSLPQPVGAVAAYLLVDQVEPLLPASLAFAAGAMLTVVVLDLLPEAWRGARGPAVAGAAIGAAAMVALSVVAGV